MDNNYWLAFDKAAGRFFRQICNLNSLAAPHVLRLEFGLVSSYILSLSAVLRWGNALLWGDEGSLRAALRMEIFDKLKDQSAFLRSFAYANDIFGLSLNSNSPMPKSALKLLLKMSASSISMARDIALSKSKSQNELVCGSALGKRLQSYLICNHPHGIRRLMLLLRINLLPLREVTGIWDKTPREERICELCHIQIQDLNHVLFVCPELQKAKCMFLRPSFINFNIHSAQEA